MPYPDRGTNIMFCADTRLRRCVFIRQHALTLLVRSVSILCADTGTSTSAPNISILIPELRHVEANDSFQKFARRHVAPRRLRIESGMANLPGTCLWRQESCITFRRPLRLDRLPKPPAPRSSPLGPLTSPPLHQAGGWPDRPASAQTRRRQALSWLSNRNLCDGGHTLRDVPQIV